MDLEALREQEGSDPYGPLRGVWRSVPVRRRNLKWAVSRLASKYAFNPDKRVDQNLQIMASLATNTFAFHRFRKIPTMHRGGRVEVDAGRIESFDRL